MTVARQMDVRANIKNSGMGYVEVDSISDRNPYKHCLLKTLSISMWTASNVI